MPASSPKRRFRTKSADSVKVPGRDRWPYHPSIRESSGLVVSVDAVAGQWCAWSFGEAWAVSDTAPRVAQLNTAAGGA